jgi:hypothetical protein
VKKLATALVQIVFAAVLAQQAACATATTEVKKAQAPQADEEAELVARLRLL